MYVKILVVAIVFGGFGEYILCLGNLAVFTFDVGFCTFVTGFGALRLIGSGVWGI